MLAAGGVQPGGRVAEGFTGVAGEVLRQFGFAPLAGPAEFAAGAAAELLFEERFPGGAAAVAEARPDEVEEFVGEDARALGGVAAEGGVEMDFAAAQVRAGDGLATAVAQAIVPDEANREAIR